MPFPLSSRSLLHLALLSSLATGAPTVHAQASGEPLPHRQDVTASFELPFKLMGGLIALQQLTLNGQRGDFVLDTGNALALLVERTTFTGQLQAATRYPTDTVTLQELPSPALTSAAPAT